MKLGEAYDRMLELQELDDEVAAAKEALAQAFSPHVKLHHQKRLDAAKERIDALRNLDI